MAKKEDIIEATFFLFAENGYHTTVDDISRKVKLKRQSLYSHFSSKDEIIWLTIEKEINQYYGFLNYTIEKVDGKSFEEQLKTIYFSVFQYFNSLEKIRFWRNISLIQNIILRDQCREKIKSNEKFTSNKVMEYFNAAYEKGFLRSDPNKGSIHLYLAMINGMLDAGLLFDGIYEEIITGTWEAYWDGIIK